jgi:uncharacterized membrane protein YqaE (UPF0057 family)
MAFLLFCIFIPWFSNLLKQGPFVSHSICNSLITSFGEV